MSALRSILAQFDIAVNSSELDAGVSKIDAFVGKLKQVGVVMAALAVAKGFTSFAEGVAHSAREIEFNAGRMEMQVDEYQKLAQVGKNYGMTLENLQIANTLFVRALSGVGGTMGEFAGRTGHARQAMHNLGIDAKQFKGKGLLEILPSIADAFEKIEDPLQRVAIGLNLFGHRGRSIMPMLAQGGAELRRQFAAMVPVFEKATIKSADRATVAGNQLSQTWDNLVNNSIGRAALNMFAKTAQRLTDIVMAVKELIKYSEIGKGIIISLGVVLAAIGIWAAITWAPFVLMAGVLLGIFAALALAVDDFIVFMKGGDSLLGDFFDELLGPGGAETAVAKIKELWESFKGFLDELKKDFGGDFGGSLKAAVQILIDMFRALKEYMGWVIEKGGVLEMLTRPSVSAAGPASDYGLAGHSPGWSGATPFAPVGNIPAPAMISNDRNIVNDVDHRPTAAEGGKGITFNMIGSIDPKRLAEDLARVAEAHTAAAVQRTMREAAANAGGSE